MNTFDIYMGSDPEFFFEKDGKIIGAEKVLSKFNGTFHSERGQVIIDGVQAELNPDPSYCRNIASSNIASTMVALEKVLPEGVTINLEQTVPVSKKELESLIPDNRCFGCTPSFNVYGDNPIGIKDASKYYKRSAGGHIHIGVYGETTKELLDPVQLVPLLDILVGNTAVLLDRSEGNIERRKNYGRAGEYRVPPHGLEYRTLSNFWLYNHTLMHLMFGLVRQAVSYLGNGKRDEILALVNREDIVRAINENDFDLAMSNFKKLIPLFNQIDGSGTFPMTKASIIPFLYLVEKGYKEVFKDGYGTYVGGSELVQYQNQGTYEKRQLRVGFENWANKMNDEFAGDKKDVYSSILKKLCEKN